MQPASDLSTVQARGGGRGQVLRVLRAGLGGGSDRTGTCDAELSRRGGFADLADDFAGGALICGSNQKVKNARRRTVATHGQPGLFQAILEKLGESFIITIPDLVDGGHTISLKWSRAWLLKR